MKKTLICGSLAYDNIMVFNGRFREQILPEQIHILNVAFLVPEMRREFGGCAGNIAYALHSLGGHAEIMATVGEDGIPYLDRLDAQGLSRQHVRKVPGTFTAQAFITTDMDDNQITAFHPGAMGQAHLNEVGHAENIGLGIVAPDGRDAMIEQDRWARHRCVRQKQKVARKGLYLCARPRCCLRLRTGDVQFRIPDLKGNLPSVFGNRHLKEKSIQRG